MRIVLYCPLSAVIVVMVIGTRHMIEIILLPSASRLKCEPMADLLGHRMRGFLTPSLLTHGPWVAYFLSRARFIAAMEGLVVAWPAEVCPAPRSALLENSVGHDPGSRATVLRNSEHMGQDTDRAPIKNVPCSCYL